MASDNTIFSNMSGSAAMQEVLISLQNQKAEANALLTQKQSELTQVQAARASCQRTGLFRTWDNGCLDQNTAQQNALNTEIANLRQRLVDLDAQIAQAQSTYQTAVATEAQQAQTQVQVLQAQAMANPETARITLEAQTAQKQAAIDADADKQQTMIYAGAGILVIIILAVAAMFIFKK